MNKVVGGWVGGEGGGAYQSYITSTSFRATPRVAVFMNATAAAAATAAESPVAAFPPLVPVGGVTQCGAFLERPACTAY